MSIESPTSIEKAEGKLGVLMPGLGAVSTTFIAGTLAVRSGLSTPIGSLTQMGSIRLGKRNERRELPIKDLDRKSTRLNSSHSQQSRMPSSA